MSELIKPQRECFACGSSKTYYDSKSNKFLWYPNGDTGLCLCSRCYGSLRQKNFLPKVEKVDNATRFWSKVKQPSSVGECWIWRASMRGGYGAFLLNGVVHNASRAAYILFYGDIPESLQVDHLCRNRKCVNPYHLEAVTQRENILRGESLPAKEAKQTHCKNGHPLEGTNLVEHQKKRGRRICRICRNSLKRKYWHAAKYGVPVSRIQGVPVEDDVIKKD